METYDWAWVDAQIDQTVSIWNECAGQWRPDARRYSPQEQQENENAYDNDLLQVEAILGLAGARADYGSTQTGIADLFGRFAARALGLDEEATELLTQDFLPVGTALASWARRFDPALSMAGIIQAARNAWTACGMQPLFGLPVSLTPSILGYSLIYPYSDNLLDDETIAREAKLRFSSRLRRRLLGEEIMPHGECERRVWSLVALIETQYPRNLYPNVFESLLAIHRAQEQSIAQLGNARSGHERDCLRVSCAKGGSSVLADACLAYGSLTRRESRFAFEWGVLLQLGDDLQDVREDMRRGSSTLFSRAAADGIPLDRLTAQLLRFSEHTRLRMNELTFGGALLRDLLARSWTSLILGAVADSREFFSSGFVREVETFSPVTFAFLRARKQRLASRQGLYAALFRVLQTSGADVDHGLPSPEIWAGRDVGGARSVAQPLPAIPQTV